MKAVLAGMVIPAADDTYPSAFGRLGKDISDHIAFVPGVAVGP